MLYTKTQAAWLLSCQKLFSEYKEIYFWTFTFRDVLNDWVYPVRWHGFIREMVWNVYGGRLGGLRVIEVHKEHGLHYHALLNKRVWVRMVRKIGKRYGIGIIDVIKADLGAAHYLSKYLDKDRFPTATRIARWHSVGNFVPVRKNAVEIISHLNNAVAEAQEAKGEKRLTRSEYFELYLKHYDLICDPKSSSYLNRSGYGRTPSEPRLSPSDLDAIWPECPEAESNTSTAASLPRSSSQDNATSTWANFDAGSLPTLGEALAHLKPKNYSELHTYLKEA